MRCWNGFGRSLLFAFLCAGASVFYLGAAQIFLGWRLAFASYLLLAAVAYLLGVARRPTSGLAAAGATGLCGLGLLLLGATASELAIALAALIGLFRSGLLYSDRGDGASGFARRFALEADLVDAVSAGEVDLDELPETSMPEEMRGLSAEERDGYIAEKAKERQDVQESISILVKKRDAYLEEEAEKRRAEGKAESFDEKVFETIRNQAASRGIAY